MDSALLILLAVVLVVAVGLFAGLGALNKKRSGLDHAFYQNQWKKIEDFKANGGAGWQLAILEADKLLDHAMKSRGIPGETMGDRLKNAKGSFMNLNAVWQSHKLRNRLAHEQNVQLNGVVVDQALRGFKAGLKDLGAL
jgi:hypothetical protein